MARKFIFNLQAVLDHRMAIEEERKRVVAEMERERLAVEDRLRECQRSIVKAKTDLRDELGARSTVGTGQAVSLGNVRMQANASLHLVAKAQQIVLELAGVHRRLEAARRELLQATTQRKAVELLKAKRFEEWKRELLRKESAEVDEINVTRHGRNQEAA